VLRLADVVPEQYRVAIWLGAGQGMRLGGVPGMEDGTRCLDFLHRELHVIQQLRHSERTHGGCYLAPPARLLDPHSFREVVDSDSRYDHNFSEVMTIMGRL
jgi:hypothetical protein